MEAWPRGLGEVRGVWGADSSPMIEGFRGVVPPG